MPRPEQFAKLPKWAQGHIGVLEMRLREQAAELAIGPDNSDTFANPFGQGSAIPPRPLGQGETIRFLLRDGGLEDSLRDYIDCRIVVRFDGSRYLEVRAADDLAIVPRSSNGAHLHAVRL